MASMHTEMPNTDFVITTVNIPDRLDQREVDDRKQEEEESAHYAWGSNLRAWARRLTPYLVLLVVVVAAGTWLSNEREALTAGRISQRLSSALQIQVRIQDSHLRTAPAPALVLTGVDLGSRLHLDEIDLQFTAPSLWKAVVSGQRRWGDVVISPTSLSLDQAKMVLGWIGMLDEAVPPSVTKVRFQELTFAGSRLLPDRYEAFTRREANGKFSSVTLRRTDIPGTMQILFTPDAAATSITFQCDAADWQPPFVPRTNWSEFLASGRISDAGLDVEKFSLGSGFGGFEGQLSVHRRDHGTPAWLASGSISSVGVDLATLVQQISTRLTPTEETRNQNPPISGTVAIEAALVGGADSLEGALGDLAADGQAKVRSAALNGINLGFAASRPNTSGAGHGGQTRFSEFSAQFIASAHALTLRQIHGVAGAMSARGEVTVGNDLSMSGLLHVDLGGSRIQAPLRIRIRGTLDHPQYGP
jgi:hypothetical protein